MQAEERFRALLEGKPIDRLPQIEWAPFWDLTRKRWISEGIPEEQATVEGIQEYFGLDKCLQTLIDQRTKDTPVADHFGAPIMATKEDYLNIIKPTLYPPVESVFSEERLEFLKRTRERGDTLHFFTVEGSFWFPRTLFGIEGHLYSFYDEPELYHLMVNDYADWLEKLFHYVFSKFRFDFMSFAEDMSYNGGPMISKALFDEFLAPFYKRLIPIIHSYEIPVFIDSDGDITLAADWYATVGIDGMFPLERQAGVDVSLYIERHPDLCFLGHFDKMCMKFGKEAMTQEFERLLPSMQKGKVIPSCDHQTPPDVSIEHYREYVKLLRIYTEKVHHDENPLSPCPVFQ